MKCSSALLALGLALAPGLSSADAIDTFKSLCLPYLQDLEGTKAAARKAGFTFTPFGDQGLFGARPGTDESIQVNVATSHPYECAVTTSDMPDPASVAARFFAELGLNPSGNKAYGQIKGQRYTFLHDSDGGEAFVVFKE